MTTIDEILKEIGYNDTPLRRDIKIAFAKWLQQKQPEIQTKISHAVTIISMKVYNKQVKLCDALEELEQEISKILTQKLLEELKK